MTFPVVADDQWAINAKFEKDHGIPTQALIGRGGVLIKADEGEVEPEDIEAALEQ